MTWQERWQGARLALAIAAALAVAAPRAEAQRREPTPFAERSHAMDATVWAANGEGVPRIMDAPDTLPVRGRSVPIEYSEWYGRRLKIHQLASWAMLPLFVAQYAAGQELLDKGDERAAGWAKDWHEPLAGATGALFAINTVTGGWNLWDARRDPAARKWRTAHALLMLVADAGFALTPAFAEDDDDGGGNRSRLDTHKTVALTSMGVAVASWVMMLPPLRRE